MIKFFAAVACMLTVGALIAFAATTATGAPYVRAGKMKAIAITGKKHSPLLPDVPTFDEAGLANFYNQKRAGYGIVAPAGTPKEYAEALKAGMAWNINTIDMLKKKGVKFDS